MSFELLEHPADIGFRAEAVNLAQLFDECARALQFIIFEPSDIEDRNIKIQLDAEGTDYESLLVNWLNELLFYVDSQSLAFDFVEVEFIGQAQIECSAFSGQGDLLKHPTELMIKGVTYHQLRIAKGDLWSAEVYVDV